MDISEIVRFDAWGKPMIDHSPLGLFSYGYLIRETEKLILDLFGRGLVSGTTHTCLGQEICQMSVVRALNHPDDYVLSNHRNHGHFLTYSGDFLGLVAEIMGRQAVFLQRKSVIRRIAQQVAYGLRAARDIERERV